MFTCLAWLFSENEDTTVQETHYSKCMPSYCHLIFHYILALSLLFIIIWNSCTHSLTRIE
uniref:Uncharacterized protein n=1 Tax=Anguilla anguilla TaxID=7936 RepID=A0A0E9SCW3_ANGAN